MTTFGTLVSRGVIITSLVLAAGCATTDEWGTWREHPTHFASGRHLEFSMRNCCDGTAQRVRRHDLAQASVEGWWGKPITVPTDQILER